MQTYLTDTKNMVFPEWESANELLTEAIENSFKIVVQKKAGNITFGLFDMETLDNFIPSIHKRKFHIVYNNFMRAFIKELGINKVLEKYVFEEYTKRTLTHIREDVRFLMAQYEEKMHTGIVDILKGVLGLPSHYLFVPNNLRTIS